jgi:hypothetical protein
MAAKDDARERELRKKRAEAIRRVRDGKKPRKSEPLSDDQDAPESPPSGTDSPSYVAWIDKKMKDER